MNLLMGDKNELILKKEEYKYVVPVDSPIRDVPDILGEEIKEGSVVLDIGCGQGKYAFLIEKGCTLYGIDIEKKAVELAQSKSYADAWCIDIENDEGLDKNPQFQYRYDAIVMQDVLEHVYDPAKVIIRYSRYLKDDGKILISVPNIAHIDILLHLLNGEFNYGQLGIMDNTHVRFFTKKSFAKMIEAINESGEASLDCRWIGGMFIDSEYCNQYEKQFKNLWKALNGDLRKNGISNLFVLTKVTSEAEKQGIAAIIKETDDAVSRLGKLSEGKMISSTPIYTHSYDSEKEWYEYVLETEKEYSQNLVKYLDEFKESFSCVENGWKAAVTAYEDIKQYAEHEIAREQANANALHGRIASMETQQKEKEGQLETQQAHILSLETESEKKDTQLKSLHEYAVLLESDRAEKDTQLKSLHEYAAQLKQDITEKEKQVAEVREQMAAIIKERDELICSTSWRITKPLRAIKNIVKK